MSAQVLTKKERAAQLAARGIGSKDIASMIGSSIKLIDRFKEDEEFKALLHLYQGALLPEDVETLASYGYTQDDIHTKFEITPEEENRVLHDKYDALEHKIVAKLYEHLELCTTARELSGVLSIISTRQAAIKNSINIQINQTAHGTGAKQQIIALNIPEHALGTDAIKLSPTNEVISVGGRSLSSLTAMETSSIIEAKRAEKKVAVLEAIDQEFPDL